MDVSWAHLVCEYHSIVQSGSGTTANFVYYWLWCCLHSHNKKIRDHSNSKSKLRKSTINEDIDMDLRRSAEEATSFASDVVAAVGECGLPQEV